MREPMRDNVTLPLKSEVGGLEDQVNLSGNQPQRQMAPSPTPVSQASLNPYQKRLLAEFQKRPDVMKLLTVIFSQYPATVIKEFRQSNPTSTKRQQKASLDTSRIRLSMEAFIEEEIAKLAGINVDQLMKDAEKEVKEVKEEKKEPEKS